MIIRRVFAFVLTVVMLLTSAYAGDNYNPDQMYDSSVTRKGVKYEASFNPYHEYALVRHLKPVLKIDDIVGLFVHDMRQRGEEGYARNVYLTDIIAFGDDGCLLAGVGMVSKMHENVYGDDMSKLVGIPYMFIYEYKGDSYLHPLFYKEMPAFYHYPYDTAVYEGASTTDSVDWLPFVIKPRFTKVRYADDTFMFLYQDNLDTDPEPHGPIYTGRSQPKIRLSEVRLKDEEWTFTPKMYANVSMFYDTARAYDMPDVYRNEYEFVPNETYIQMDNVYGFNAYIINMYKEDVGISYMFDLSSHGNPQYKKTYWK